VLSSVELVNDSVSIKFVWYNLEVLRLSPCLFNYKPHITLKTASVVKWSEFLATDPEARVRFPALPQKKVVGLERGLLILGSTTEELLDKKVGAPV
jgi:hypothetical protein